MNLIILSRARICRNPEILNHQHSAIDLVFAMLICNLQKRSQQKSMWVNCLSTANNSYFFLSFDRWKENGLFNSYFLTSGKRWPLQLFLSFFLSQFLFWDKARQWIVAALQNSIQLPTCLDLLFLFIYSFQPCLDLLFLSVYLTLSQNSMQLLAMFGSLILIYLTLSVRMAFLLQYLDPFILFYSFNICAFFLFMFVL